MIDDEQGSIPPDAIDIDVPLLARHGATLRLLVAALGADAGFSVDELDDLKLAVSEVFTILVESADGGASRAQLRLTVDADGFVIRLRVPQSREPIELDQLSAAILSSVADEHEVGADGVRIVKRVAESRA